MLLNRLEHEYRVPAVLHPLSWRHARWVTGPARAIGEAASGHGRTLVYDARRRPLLLFETEWTLRYVMEKAASLEFHEVSP